MLSVCLPIYNYDVCSLLRGLLHQAADLPATVEIVALDDASEPEWQARNAKLSQWQGINYQILPENVGRARIRNLLAQTATEPYLIFLDSDMSLVSEDFLANYLALAQAGASVVCGGHVYDPQPPARKRRLHWRYGITRETPPLTQRQQQPYQSFKTSNFMVRREIMLAIGFDERLRQYGHEDTLFGFRLEEAGIPLQQIDNPLRHDDLEINDIFLQKNERALINLARIQREFDLPPHFADGILLLSTVERLRKHGLLGLVKAGFWLLKPGLRLWLRSGYAPVAIFNAYKLGVYARLG